MGGAKPEDLHTWIDAFATVGSLGGQVSISSAIIEERLATTNAVREATIGCRKTLTALRLKGTSAIQGEIKTHLGVLVSLLTKLESHSAELHTLREFASSGGPPSVASRDENAKRARLEEKLELLADSSRRQLDSASALSYADTVVSMSGAGSEVGSLDVVMGAASIDPVMRESAKVEASASLGSRLATVGEGGLLESVPEPEPTVVHPVVPVSSSEVEQADPGMRSHSPAVSSGPGEPEAKIPALAKEVDDGHPAPPQVVPRSERTEPSSVVHAEPESIPVAAGTTQAPASGYPSKRTRSKKRGATFSLGDPALEEHPRRRIQGLPNSHDGCHPQGFHHHQRSQIQ